MLDLMTLGLSMGAQSDLEKMRKGIDGEGTFLEGEYFYGEDFCFRDE